jgi:N-acetylmuramoyl-L-alanine amidase
MKFRAVTSLLHAGLLLIAAPLAMAAAKVESAQLEATDPSSIRLTLNLSAAPLQSVFTLEKPWRVVIDLKSAELARGLKLPPPQGPVKSLRSGPQPGGKLRIVMELDRPHTRLQSSTRGNQLVVELGTAAVVPVVASPPAPAPVRAAHAPADAGRDIIVAVDAGHGGVDPGASGASGTHEKDVVLAIARELAKRIDAEPGMKAVLTRDADKFIALRERINIARRARADIFISVHADAIRNRDVSGSSVYVLSSRGASNEAARLLADRENAADLKGGVSLGDMDNSLASVLMDVAQTASITHSMEAADRVLDQLDRVGVIRKTQVQPAPFLVLKSPDIPSMLVETAYISNPGEEKKLRTPEHQAAVAEAIFNGVRDYFRQSPPDGTLFKRQQDGRRGSPAIIAGSAAP